MSTLIGTEIKFSRTWAMPNHDTFSVPPIGAFVRRYLEDSTISIDPFARDKEWATHTNDLSPNTKAKHHLDAEEFLKLMRSEGVLADLVIFDPPYSPRQISECYKSIGMEVGMKETQSALLYQRVRNAIIPVLAPGGALSCHSAGTASAWARSTDLNKWRLCCAATAGRTTTPFASQNGALPTPNPPSE